MTSNFLYLGLSTLHFSFLWRTAKTIFAQSNNPTPLNKAPGTTLGGGGGGRKQCNRNVCKEQKGAFGEICH